jgi:hypothetical protein
MKCIIKVTMDNAAFEDYDELPSILRGLAQRLAGDRGLKELPLYDTNGNKVGEMKITGRPKHWQE